MTTEQFYDAVSAQTAQIVSSFVFETPYKEEVFRNKIYSEAYNNSFNNLTASEQDAVKLYEAEAEREAAEYAAFCAQQKLFEEDEIFFLEMEKEKDAVLLEDKDCLW